MSATSCWLTGFSCKFKKKQKYKTKSQTTTKQTIYTPIKAIFYLIRLPLPKKLWLRSLRLNFSLLGRTLFNWMSRKTSLLFFKVNYRPCLFFRAKFKLFLVRFSFVTRTTAACQTGASTCPDQVVKSYISDVTHSSYTFQNKT